MDPLEMMMMSPVVRRDAPLFIDQVLPWIAYPAPKPGETSAERRRRTAAIQGQRPSARLQLVEHLILSKKPCYTEQG